MASAHKGLITRPSDNLKTCGMCHKEIADNYAKALHYTSGGQRNGVLPRFSPAEARIFDQKVFQDSCRSCHASCGDCHVQSPRVGGISIGLIKGHAFVKRDEGKTCAFCHGGRVYPELTGEYGGQADVHYQRGMTCLDCHNKTELHGDGQVYASKNNVKDRPVCLKCHKLGGEAKLLTRAAHEKHRGKVSCYGCHVGGEYRGCYDCHPATGSKSKPQFTLGLSPRDKKVLTTLRHVPTVRDTFAPAGIRMENFDAVPNLWDSPVHEIRKRTDRTANCDSCHVEGENFLKKEMLSETGSKANMELIPKVKPIKP